MTDQPGAPLDDRQLLHQFKNYLAVIIGFCDLMLSDLPEDADLRRDVAEVRTAAQSAMALMPELARRLD